MAAVIAETVRLVIRRLTENDVEAVATMWCDPRVTRFMGGPRVFAEVCRSLRAGLSAEPQRFDLWPVLERSGGAVIGHCGLLDKEIDGRVEIEINYVIAPRVWRQGYATEAALAIRAHAEHAFGCRRLIALIHPENRPSFRVAEKIGFGYERDVARPKGTMRLYGWPGS